MPGTMGSRPLQPGARKGVVLAAIIGYLMTCLAAVPAQARRQAPTTLKLAPGATGELSAGASFTLGISPLAMHTPAEFKIEPQPGTLRVTCTWQADSALWVSVTGAAGHGLPGRISLNSVTGGSPLTVEVQVSAEQVARGPIYVEVTRSHSERQSKVVVRGQILASLSQSGEAPQSGRDSELSALEEGRLLSLPEVDALESKLARNPHDWLARLSLLAYYTSSAGLRMTKPQIIAARRRHVLWAIANRPAAPDIFYLQELQIGKQGPLADPAGIEEGLNAWQRALAPARDDAQVEFNAVAFAVEVAPGFAETVIQRAQTRDLEDPRWSRLLGWLYATAMVTDADAAFTERARQALRSSQDAEMLSVAAAVLARPGLVFTRSQPEFRLARPKYLNLAEALASRAVSFDREAPSRLALMLYVLSIEVLTAETAEQKLSANKKVYELFQHFGDVTVDPAARTYLLPVLANLAFDVNDLAAAKDYGKEALELASSQAANIEGVAIGPQAIHDANDVLGRVAVREGNLPLAKEYLLKAALTPGGGALTTYGPRMLLAQALLDRGEREVVIQYLTEMKAVWKGGKAVLDRWIANIRRGRPERLNQVDANRALVPGASIRPRP